LALQLQVVQLLIIPLRLGLRTLLCLCTHGCYACNLLPRLRNALGSPLILLQAR
jgi:hypothetical protein